MPGDSRKDFILATTANYFAVDVNDGSLKNLPDSPALNSFLDDGNASVLGGKLDPKSRVKLVTFANKVSMSTPPPHTHTIKKTSKISFVRCRQVVFAFPNLNSQTSKKKIK